MAPADANDGGGGGSPQPAAAAAAPSAPAAADDDQRPADLELLLSRVTTLGLTGSIGMGKSAVAAMLAGLSVPVLDADAVVHTLYAPGGAAVAPVSEAFGGGGGGGGGGAKGGEGGGGEGEGEGEGESPSSRQGGVLTPEGGVCRQSLSRRVLGDEAAMRRLEAIVHPLVAQERRAFLLRCARDGVALAALDVPLLFETGADGDVDAVAVASAPAGAQRARVLARPGMTAERFEAVLARQVPDEEKRRRADFVIDTGRADMAETRAAVAAMVALLKGGEAEAGAGAAAGAGALVVARGWRLEEARARRRRQRG